MPSQSLPSRTSRGLDKSMGEFFSGVHSLDKLDTLTCPILCQVVAIMHYVISSHPGLMFLSTTEEN